MTVDATPAAELQARAGSLLAPLVDIQVKDDGSLGFEYAGALCSLRALNLADGLDVLSMLCVLAWDQPANPRLREQIAECNDVLQFGAITWIGHADAADALLRYTFPAAGLADEALATMLFLVLSGADDARKRLGL